MKRAGLVLLVLLVLLAGTVLALRRWAPGVLPEFLTRPFPGLGKPRPPGAPSKSDVADFIAGNTGRA